MSALTGLINEYFNATGNIDPFLKTYVDSGANQEMISGLKDEKKELKKILINGIDYAKNYDLIPQFAAASLKYAKFDKFSDLSLDDKIACHFLGEVIQNGKTEYVSKILPHISTINIDKTEKEFQIKSELNSIINYNDALSNHSVKYPHNFWSGIGYIMLGEALMFIGPAIPSESLSLTLLLMGFCIAVMGAGFFYRTNKNEYSRSSERFRVERNVREFVNTLF